MFTTGTLSYKGQATGVVYGFLSTLFRVMSRYQPTNVVLCWDSKYSDRRDKLYSGYKGSRRTKVRSPKEEAQRADCFQQLAKLRTTILPKLGFRNSIRVRGLEADDLIASVVQQSLDAFCVIVSSDGDLLQLLRSDRVEVHSPIKDKLISEHTLKQDKGITPQDVIQIKALSGCPTDSVPHAVPGLGIKTVTDYLIYGKGRLPQARQRLLAQALMSKQYQVNLKLVTLPLRTLRVNLFRPGLLFNMDALSDVCAEEGIMTLMSRVPPYLRRSR